MQDTEQIVVNRRFGGLSEDDDDELDQLAHEVGMDLIDSGVGLDEIGGRHLQHLFSPEPRSRHQEERELLLNALRGSDELLGFALVEPDTHPVFLRVVFQSHCSVSCMAYTLSNGATNP